MKNQPYIEQSVRNMVAKIDEHPALDNAFYTLWMTTPLNPEQIKVFARNYLARTANTSMMVCLSFMSAKDIISRTEIVKNLFSEFGYGNPEKVHFCLLERFLSTLITRVQGSQFELTELATLPILETTQRFIARQRSLYTDANDRVVLGTLLGQEWLAYSMLTRLYEGARVYMGLFPLDEFHEVCEYFYVHIGDAEKDHKEQAVIAACQACSDEQDLDCLAQGFHGFLDITATFWGGMAQAIADVSAASATMPCEVISTSYRHLSLAVG